MGIRFVGVPKSNDRVAIYCVLQYAARIRPYTGIMVPFKDWDEKRYRLKQRGTVTYYDENEKLKYFQETAEKTIRHFKKEYIKPKVSQLREMFDFFFKDEKISDNPLLFELGQTYVRDCLPAQPEKPSRNTAHNSHYQTIRLLQDKFKTVSVDYIDMAFYHSLVKYCTHVKKYSINNTGKHIKNIKSWLNFAVRRGITKNRIHTDRAFKILEQDSQAIYLTLEELDILHKTDCGQLEKYKKMFLLGCHTGMRVGDLINLDFKIVGDYIQYKQEKTGARVAIPVTDKIKMYLKDVISVSSDVLLNRHVKTCCKLAGINNWAKVTSHTMRRSFATNDFILGVPIRLIMAITGHQTEKAFMRYIRLSKTEEAGLYAQFKAKRLLETAS